MHNKFSAYKMYLIYSGATSFLFALMFTLTSIFYINTVKVNPFQLVLIGTVLETACFIFEIPTGIVADIYSRRLSIIIGAAMIGIGFLLEGAIPLYASVLGAQVIWGAGATFLSGAEDAWIADEVGEENLDRVYIRGAQTGQIASILGIAASSILGSIILRLPIILSGVLFICFSVFLMIFMPENGFKPTPAEDKNTWQKMTHTFVTGLKFIRKSTLLMTIVGIALFYGLYSEGIDRLWGAHFLKDYVFPTGIHFTPAIWFGIIQIASSMLGIFAVEIIKRRMDRDGRLDSAWVLIVINVLLVGSIIAFGAAGNFTVAFAVYMSLCIFRKVNDPIYRAWMNKGIESGVRATVISTMGQLDAFGQIIGGVVIGFIAKQVSISMAVIAAGIILSPVIAMYAYAISKGRTQAGDINLEHNDA